MSPDGCCILYEVKRFSVFLNVMYNNMYRVYDVWIQVLKYVTFVGYNIIDMSFVWIFV